MHATFGRPPAEVAVVPFPPDAPRAALVEALAAARQRVPLGAGQTAGNGARTRTSAVTVPRSPGRSPPDAGRSARIGAVAALALLLVALNAVSFALFGIDKRRARRGARRIPEATLLLSALVSGTVGAWLGDAGLSGTRPASASFLAAMVLVTVVDAVIVVLVLRGRS